MTADGKVNILLVDDQPGKLLSYETILASLGEWLVDIHGPHEHQSLIHPSRQLAILDAFANLDAERSAFAELVKRRGALEAEKAALVIDEKTYSQQLELLQFQAQEIAVAQLGASEEEQTEQEYKRGTNAAKLLQLSQTAMGLLSESETSLLTQAMILGRTLHELQRFDPGTASIIKLHHQAVALLQDLQSELSRYVDKVDLEPARLQQLIVLADAGIAIDPLPEDTEIIQRGIVPG